ncbi:hypothetical protein B1R94_28315 [Mycolicibacterium litorale]|nr:hypothetical protein B1R94_28315 [Mycolicibacterium litorale]
MVTALPVPDGDDALGTILRAAVLLHDNGQSTSMTLTAVQRLSTGLAQPAVVIPEWSSVTAYDPRGGGRDVLISEAHPNAVNMRRVAALMSAVDHAETRPLGREEIERALDTARRLPAASNLAFVCACGVGAAALAVVFGADDVRTVAVIAVAAALGVCCVACWPGWEAMPFCRSSSLPWSPGWLVRSPARPGCRHRWAWSRSAPRWCWCPGLRF